MWRPPLLAKTLQDIQVLWVKSWMYGAHFMYFCVWCSPVVPLALGEEQQEYLLLEECESRSAPPECQWVKSISVKNTILNNTHTFMGNSQILLVLLEHLHTYYNNLLKFYWDVTKMGWYVFLPSVLKSVSMLSLNQNLCETWFAWLCLALTLPALVV